MLPSTVLCWFVVLLETQAVGKMFIKGRHFKDNPALDKAAMFGSKRSRSEDIELPADVKRTRLITLVKSHDANKDDILSFDELENWIMEAFRIMDYDEALDDFEVADSNKDGKVDAEESLLQSYETTAESLEVLVAKAKADNLTMAEDIAYELTQGDRKLYSTADKDNDGFLDKFEYQYYRQPQHYPEMAEIVIDSGMGAYDTNKNGFISLEELTKVDDNMKATQQTMEIFYHLDTDGDKRLSRNEMRIVLVQDNREESLNEVTRLLKEADVNKDGSLSIEEIVDKEYTFFLSLGTNYGKHLHFVKDEL